MAPRNNTHTLEGTFQALYRVEANLAGQVESGRVKVT